MKNCPFCAEAIQDEAIKCKHCGSSLVKSPSILSAILPKTKFSRSIVSVVLFVVVILFIYQAIIYKDRSLVEKSITNKALIEYGYTLDKYSFKLSEYNHSGSMKTATLNVTVISTNDTWNIRYMSFDNDDWQLDVEQNRIEMSDISELKQSLSVLMRNRVGDNVYYSKEDANKMKELVGKYKLKHPNTKLFQNLDI